MQALIDSHCHLDAPEFDADRDQVLRRAADRGVVGIVVPAVSARAWPGLARLSGQHRQLFAGFGLHPMFLDQHWPEHLQQLSLFLDSGQAVAVGECGLDHFVEGLDRARQQFFFDAQLQLAKDFGLPLILHARRAVEEVILAIRRVGGLRGVVHSYSGSIEQAAQLWRLGFCIGIGGPVTFERAHRLRAVVAAIPLQQLLLESDAPDQPSAARRGQRNSPEFLDEILQAVARIRAEPVEVLAEASSENACRLFGLPPALELAARCGMVGR